MGFPLVPLETNCPIGVRATLEKSRSLFAPQRLEVTLTNPHLPVSSLGITVQGMAPIANSPAQSESTESLDLNRAMDPRPYTSTEQKESSKGQGQMAELDAILGTIGRTGAHTQYLAPEMVCQGDRLHFRQLYRFGFRELCRRDKLAGPKWEGLPDLACGCTLTLFRSTPLCASNVDGFTAGIRIANPRLNDSGSKLFDIW